MFAHASKRSMGVSPMSTTGILPVGSVGLPSHGRARMALRLMARMAMPRRERVGILIIVVYLPPAGKGNFFQGNFFQPGVRGRVARQSVAPGVRDVGVRVAGGITGPLAISVSVPQTGIVSLSHYQPPTPSLHSAMGTCPAPSTSNSELPIQTAK